MLWRRGLTSVHWSPLCLRDSVVISLSTYGTLLDWDEDWDDKREELRPARVPIIVLIIIPIISQSLPEA